MHLSTSMLIYRDLISKLAKYLLFISMSVNLLRRDPEFLMCVSLMVPNRGDNILARSLAILWWEADPMLEIIGHKGISGLWGSGRP